MKGLLHTIIHWQTRLVILLSILFSGITLQAQNTENETARKYAADFFNTMQQKSTGLKSAVAPAELTQTYQSSEKVKTPLYVFCQEEKGFAMVAQSGSNYAVVGYSDESIFQSENIPPQLRALMNYYEDSLKFSNPVSATISVGTPVVPALLNEHGIKLNQFNHSEVGGSYTGCMATAITQIMLFHAAEQNKPIKGYGSHCYTYGSFGEICADFENITYNSAELLSYHVAVAMDMQFTTEGSSPPSVDKINNIEEYFRFFVKGTISEDFYIKNELQHRRPVYSSLIGWPENHAVVIDGYDDRGYYHLNFGWGGHFNGYFLMNNNAWFGTGNAGQKFHSNFLSVHILTPSQMPVNEQDSLALIAIHNALGGYEATQWDLTKSVWKWPGVLVMNDRVIRLTLAPEIAPATSQSIAAEIGNLTALQELSIAGCLNGNIPSTITNLSELKELHIANLAVYTNSTLNKGNLKSTLPSDISKLTNLEWLSLHNALKGAIPSSIGSLAKLKLLHISQDTTYLGKGDLNGTIPSTIGNLSNLQSLNITDQQLSGTLSETIGTLSGLVEINLSGNQLSGNIPSMNLPELVYLKLNNNQFSDFAEEKWNCPVLRNIELQNNKITGNLPAYFGNFNALKSLNLSDNQINSLPEEVGNLIQLESLAINNNQLQALPDGLALILMLKHLSASNNQIAYIPSNFAQSRSLETLDLSSNQITFIPEEIGNCPDLYQIYLNNNKITSIPASFANMRDAATILLHDNEMQGAIPEKLITAASNINKFVRLENNRFVFNDIPQSDQLDFGVRDQKNVPIKKQIYKVQFGDTVSIDIREITRLSNPANEYYWLSYPEFSEATVKDERMDGIENNPILKFIVDAETVNNKYYCKIFNAQSPTFSFEYNGSTYTSACMEYLNTDTIALQLATDEEIISEKYTNEFVTSLASITDKTVSDGTVTLVPPLKVKRGEIYWEASADGETWERVSENMERADLKANLKSVSNEQLVLAPRNTAFYRCCVLETDCDPIFSEALKVEAQGNVLFDEVINVTEESRTIDVDSIEVIVPQYFYDGDFRMTITKIENPPPSSDIFLSGSTYDVTVSFSDTFNIPLVIKLKNIDKTKVNEKEINRFEAVYFDDKNREWKRFEESHLSLKDSTLIFLTNHLTKMKWWWYTEEYRMGFTDIYERKNILVFYKDNDTPFMNLDYPKNQKSKPWHVNEIPLLVQDITEYLPEVMTKYKSLGLEVPDGKFKVYVEDLKGEDGAVDPFGMLYGYLTIGRGLSNPTELQQALAHEYMHYSQDYYISAHGGNLFWMEAHATLSDRIVWDTTKISVCESEELLLKGRKVKKGSNYTFNSLANSWDYYDVSIATNAYYNQFDNEKVQYYYTAGTFLHYMRSYRKESKKLEPATLLKETSWLGSWRTYLAGYTSNHLDAILGDEYEDFVKYILSGVNEKFTLLNKSGNPYVYLQDPENKGVFTYPVTYRFKEGDEMVQKDEMDIEVPYLASKIVLLENTNPDTMVLVNYKRKHDFDYDHLVYYATYDAKKQEMIFVDISDSTEYNFLLDARNKENSLTKFNNYSFLLLINKEYIGASDLIKDFDASFELTAMPVLNIESVGMLTIYNGSSHILHNFSDKPEYIFIGTPNADYLQEALEMDVKMVDKNTTKQILNDQTYQIKTQFTLIIDQGQIKGMPTMKDSTIYTQTIEHDIISGIIKVTEDVHNIHKMYTYIEFVAGPDGDFVERIVEPGYTYQIEYRTKTYWLENIMNYIQPETVTSGYKEEYGQNIVMFKTNSTNETQQVVKKIDGSIKTTKYNKDGTVSSVQESTYVGTDYSNPNLNLLFIIRTKEEE